jgi:hypothetical protein
MLPQHYFPFLFIEICSHRFIFQIFCVALFGFIFVHCALQLHHSTVAEMASLGLNRLFGNVSLFFFFWCLSLRVAQNTGHKFHIYIEGSGYFCCKVEFWSVKVEVVNFPSLAAHCVVQCGRLSGRLTARLNDTAVPHSEQSSGTKIKCVAVRMIQGAYVLV